MLSYRMITIAGLFSIVLFGFYLRYEYVSTARIISPIRADARDYYVIADNMVNKGVYSQEWSEHPTPDAIRTPGYPLFLAGLLLVSSTLDSFYENVLLTQVLIDTFSIVLVFLLLCYFLPPPFALIGSFLYALSPHLIVMAGYFLTETLFTFLLLSTLLLLFIAMKRDYHIFYLFSSLVMGMAALVRPTLLFLPLFFLPFFFVLFRKDRRKVSLVFTLLIAGIVITHTPWWIRNYVVLGKMGDNRVAVRTFAQGFAPEFINMTDNPELSGAISSFPKTLTVLKDRVKKEPIKYIKWFTYQKFSIFWQWGVIQGVNDIFIYPVASSTFHEQTTYKIINNGMKLLHPMFLLLALLSPLIIVMECLQGGIFMSRIWPVTVFVIVTLYFTVFHLLMVPLPRYAIPLKPVLYGLALFSIHSVLSFIMHRFVSTLSDSEVI